MGNIDVITNEIVDSSRQLYGNRLWRVLLYGSYARGDFDSESDLDIMILLDCDEKEVRQYRKNTSRMASRIGLNNDIEISLLVRDKASFEQRQQFLPFYRNVKNEGVVLYG